MLMLQLFCIDSITTSKPSLQFSNGNYSLGNVGLSLPGAHELVTNAWLLALASDGGTDSINEQIVELACAHSIGIFILSKLDLRKKILQHSQTCAPIIFKSEEELGIKLQEKMNRIEKLSYLRDIQRQIMTDHFRMQQNRYDGVVIVADFDLKRWPRTSVIMENIEILKGNKKISAICANGIVKKKYAKYYDTFATVLLPDTFMTILEKRLFPQPYKGETEHFVRTNDKPNTGFSQEAMFQYFRQMGKSQPGEIVNVRSCFGGLTIYKANLYFDGECKYQLQDEIIKQRDVESVMRYSSKDDGRPCEHVVLHECFRKRLNETEFNIGVSSKMIAVR
ncbi:hypothetical protein CTEN210_06303 [Chaetoceros tenuissimus]|uniref:Uncharacterized protein n=1 Tax=Chaetoceros tenuissimus TaxID=426638 RepID=A0AAD3CPL5_9STRA|nr:hypothetical protein CTEN210_06303 [Chaetoceros tenuissimus]